MLSSSRSSRPPGCSLGVLVVVVVALAVGVGAVLLRSAGAAGAGQPLPGSLPGQPAQLGRIVNYLRFNGTATVWVTPDKATLEFTVKGSGMGLDEAVEQAKAKMRGLLGALTRGGVAPGDLAPGRIWAGPDDKQPGRFISTEDLAVTVRDPARAWTLLTLGNANGASSSTGPAFTIRDRDESYATALRRAVKAARGEAEAAVGVLGGKLAAVVAIEERGDSQRPTLEPAMPAVPVKGDPAKTAPPAFATQKLTVSVAVTFSYTP